MDTKIYDIAIIGAGPAGYSASIKASMKGLSVVLFEKDHAGGTCLNKGCIPTKSILHNTNLIYETKSLTKYGVKSDLSEFSFSNFLNC